MSAASVRVARALANVRHLVSAARTHRPVVLEGAAAFWATDATVLAHTFDAAVTSLQRAADGLQAAELARVSELADDEAPRLQRDAAEHHLRQTLLRTGNLLALAFPDTPALSVPPLASSNARLLLDAAGVLHRLQATDRAGDIATLGVVVTTHQLAGSLETAIEAYKAAVAVVRDEAQELAAVLVARDLALEHFRTTYRSSGLLLEGFFRAAQRPDLADRLRPTDRRTSGRTGVASNSDATPQT